MQTVNTVGNEVPLYAPCNKLSMTAPFRWLKQGWQDYKRAPWHSLAYGVLFVLIGWALFYFAWSRQTDTLIFSSMLGFLFIGPVLAFGLYDLSHELELKHKPSFRHERQKAICEIGHEMMLAVLLSLMFPILAIIVPLIVESVAASATTNGAAGTISTAASISIAVAFAVLVFCCSVFALPMILHQDARASTAMMTSINAVMRNKRVSLLWALMIIALTAIGFATAMIALAVIVPVLGYATWHGYRETIIAKE